MIMEKKNYHIMTNKNDGNLTTHPWLVSAL